MATASGVSHAQRVQQASAMLNRVGTCQWKLPWSSV
jgi:hypothetical protein